MCLTESKRSKRNTDSVLRGVSTLITNQFLAIKKLIEGKEEFGGPLVIVFLILHSKHLLNAYCFSYFFMTLLSHQIRKAEKSFG